MGVKRELSTPQVAAVVGCSSDHVYKLVQRGLLAFDVVGKKKRLFDVGEVKAAMAVRRQQVKDEDAERLEKRRLKAEKKKAARGKRVALDSNWATDGKQDKIDVGKPDDAYWVGVRKAENGNGGGKGFDWSARVMGEVRPLPPMVGR